MRQKTKNIQKRYDGFLQTSCLWKDDAVYELNQFEITKKSSKINIEIDEKLRLGKYIERFVSYQLEQENNIDIVCENVQIQQEKRTLGELDCIILKDRNPIHLEIIYKFYVYDSAVGESEVDHFIGPNRKDSLVEKLTKLKEKQLPLLYTDSCSEYLKTINLDSTKIKQQVYFKTQLFIPISNQNIQLTALNKNCIVGFYSNQKELEQFTDCKFHIPIKKDWLIKPHQNVNWLNFNQFENDSKEYLERNFSPLCWLKKPNGTMEKFFLIWWN
jgi:hypothetical protein